MALGTGSRIAIALALGAAGAVASQAGTSGPTTQITVWAGRPTTAAYGGLDYGGAPATTGALISERRDIDVTSGESRVTGVAATLLPGSVQLRDLTDPAAAVTEQRYIAGAATPSELLSEHLGDPVTVVTQRGEVTGTLRAADEQVIAVEVGSGDQRHLQLLRRDSYVQDIRLPSSPLTGEPSLIWRIRTSKPGKHTVELSYRVDGMTWSADYLGVLDDASKTVELTAWATIINSTGASFDAAALTLVGSDPPPGRPAARFAVPAPARLARGHAVQVALAPPRRAAVRTVVTYEAMPDPAAASQVAASVDCSQLNATDLGGGHAETDLEIDLPGQLALPDGQARLFRRTTDHLELISEGPLQLGAGLARLRVAATTDIAGERHALACTYDEHSHTLRETLELRIENRAKQASDVVIREQLWRWPSWHIESEDHQGVRAGPQLEEYRVRVPASGSQSVTYTAVYTW